MNHAVHSKSHELYTKCDARREALCISQLTAFIAELMHHRTELENQLQSWIPCLAQLTVFTMKLHILVNNKQDEFVIYDEVATSSVIEVMCVQQQHIFTLLQDDLRVSSQSFVMLRKSYDALTKTTENIDWHVNSALITGDFRLTPFADLMAEARNIAFYFKIFMDNLVEKVNCVEIHRTDIKCVKNLLDNSRMSDAFLKACDDFVTASRRQIDCFNSKACENCAR